jgi:CheY-like chemotaxis protein
MSFSIVIADDDPIALQLARVQLERQGFVIATTDDGEKALAMILANSYDLAILDVEMPAMRGVEVSRVVREAGRDIRIILLSGTIGNTCACCDPCASCGADLFIAKPYRHNRMMEAISALFPPERLQSNSQT